MSRTFLEHEGIDGDHLDDRKFAEAPIGALLAHALNNGDDDPVRWGIDGVIAELETIWEASRKLDPWLCASLHQIQGRLQVIAELHRRQLERAEAELEAELEGAQRLHTAPARSPLHLVGDAKEGP